MGIGYLAGDNQLASNVTRPMEEQTTNSLQTKSTSRERQAREIFADEMLAGILKIRVLMDLSDGEVAKIVIQLSKYDPTHNPVVRARQYYQLELLKKLPASRLW